MASRLEPPRRIRCHTGPARSPWTGLALTAALTGACSDDGPTAPATPTEIAELERIDYVPVPGFEQASESVLGK